MSNNTASSSAAQDNTSKVRAKGEQSFHVLHDDDTLIPTNMTLYDALEKRGLIYPGAQPQKMGSHLVPDGHIGLVSEAGKYYFLKTGYYTLSSVRAHFHGVVSITDQRIDFKDGDRKDSIPMITIVTVPQGSLGLSHISGITKILEPGQHVLQIPHKYERTVNANERYINLGTYHRILVSPNEVAIAFDGRNSLMIFHERVMQVMEELDAKGHHKLADVSDKYRRSGVFEVIHNTFMFDPKTGFNSLMIMEQSISKLEFTTGDSSYEGTVNAIVRYRVVDPYLAFLSVQQVHEDVGRQARATLGDIMRRLTLDSYSLVPPSRNMPSSSGDSGSGSKDESYAVWVSSIFHSELEAVVSRWGIGDISLRIESIKPSESTKKMLQDRARIKMETATSASVADTLTQTAIATAKRDLAVRAVESEAAAQTNVMMARAEAQATEIRAAAEAKALELTSSAEAKARVLAANAEYESISLRLKAYSQMGLNPDMMALLEFSHMNVEKAKELAKTKQGTMVISADLDLSGIAATRNFQAQMSQMQKLRSEVADQPKKHHN